MLLLVASRASINHHLLFKFIIYSTFWLHGGEFVYFLLNVIKQIW